MKPILLEMHAFGPYGDRAVVDFEPLADVGLFVVSGPTGAGKSTIFDAICFALYGSLSGARASHSDVRSHYAEPHAKCAVRLVFDAEGQRWRVDRQPSQTVQKQRGVGTTVQPATAVLERWNGADWEPDTTKVRDVSARCRDLVGLSLEQFERVVLLPQGKFAEVLNAKTSERSELLRTLFGSEVFDRAADILAEQAKEGERSLQGVNEQRAFFHERAVDAIEGITTDLAELPEDTARLITSIPPATPLVETQLSLLDAVADAPADLDTPVLDLSPAGDLEALVSGPVARLSELVERRRLDAEAARTSRDRAEAQRRAIEQRTETLRLLQVLEAQTNEMGAVADRKATGRKLLGLDVAIADRQTRRKQLDQVQLTMIQLWEQSQGLVVHALPADGIDLVDRSPTPAVVADLMDRLASRTAALDLVAEERQRVELLRRERSSLVERLAHLDAIEERARTEAAASAAESAALAAEEAQLQAIAGQRSQLSDQITALDKLLTLRHRADAVNASLSQHNEHLVAAEAGASAAQAAIAAADAEIAELSVAADEVPARRTLAAQAKRRCDRRSEFDLATGELQLASAAAEAAKDSADKTFAAFVGQTAPRLAAQLVDEAPCPVCGSCQHPAPARDHDSDAARPVDAIAVERASAVASTAEAEQSRWRTMVANLIADDPQLAAIDLAELSRASNVATELLAAAEQAVVSRQQLAASRTQLQDHLAQTRESVERATAEVARMQLELREVQGALGDAARRSRSELVAERAAVVEQQLESESAGDRLVWIKARTEEITNAAIEADRLSRQRAIDRATAAERIEQLTTSIVASEEQLGLVLGGEDFSVRRNAVQALRSVLSRWQDHALTLARVEVAQSSSEATCSAIVEAAGFEHEEAAVAAIIPPAALEQLEASHGRWSHELAAHRAALATFDVQELPDESPDLQQLNVAALAAAELHRDVNHVLTSIQHAVQSAQADLDEVAALDAAHAQKRAAHETMQRVANVVRGQNSRRLSLENWVLSVYLHDVVEHANLHLAKMSNGRYRLAVQDAPSSQVGQHGLGLVVDDAHTGRVRSSMSLSGGETFQASLALALGLADVVMLGRAGLHLDALFVDEGFGSLDADAIDQAISVLDGLRSRGSMVGVITHVEALKNALPVAIDVQPRADHRGSQIRQVA